MSGPISVIPCHQIDLIHLLKLKYARTKTRTTLYTRNNHKYSNMTLHYTFIHVNRNWNWNYCFFSPLCFAKFVSLWNDGNVLQHRKTFHLSLTKTMRILAGINLKRTIFCFCFRFELVEIYCLTFTHQHTSVFIDFISFYSSHALLRLTTTTRITPN